MELNITHLQHYPMGGENALNITNGEEIKKVDGIYTFDNKKEFWLKSDGWNLHCDSWKPLLLPLSALYEEIDGEIGIVQLIHISSGADTPDIKKSRVVKIGSNYKVLYNSILDIKDIWYSASLEYNEGKWSYYWEGELTEFNQLALFDYLFSHHYDPYGFIDKGLAIDKRSVK